MAIILLVYSFAIQSLRKNRIGSELLLYGPILSTLEISTQCNEWKTIQFSEVNKFIYTQMVRHQKIYVFLLWCSWTNEFLWAKNLEIRKTGLPNASYRLSFHFENKMIFNRFLYRLNMKSIFHYWRICKYPCKMRNLDDRFLAISMCMNI